MINVIFAVVCAHLVGVATVLGVWSSVVIGSVACALNLYVIYRFRLTKHKM